MAGRVALEQVADDVLWGCASSHGFSAACGMGAMQGAMQGGVRAGGVRALSYTASELACSSKAPPPGEKVACRMNIRRKSGFIRHVCVVVVPRRAFTATASYSKRLSSAGSSGRFRTQALTPVERPVAAARAGERGSLARTAAASTAVA